MTPRPCHSAAEGSRSRFVAALLCYGDAVALAVALAFIVGGVVSAVAMRSPPTTVVVDADGTAQSTSGRPYTLAFAVTSAAVTTLELSPSQPTKSMRCVVRTSSTPLYLVAPSAADTADGEGPYCDGCAAGAVVVVPAAKAYARTSSGTADVRCSFYDGDIAPGGGGPGGLSAAAADATYFRVDASNGPLTDDVVVDGSVESTAGGFVFPDGSVQTTAASAGVGGSGSADRVALWSDADTLSSSSGLTYSDGAAALNIAPPAVNNTRVRVRTQNGTGSGFVAGTVGFSRASTSYSSGLEFYSGNNFDSLDWFFGQVDDNGITGRLSARLNGAAGTEYFAVDAGCVGVGAACSSAARTAGVSLEVTSGGAAVFDVGTSTAPGLLKAQNDTSGTVGALWLPPRSVGATVGTLPACDSTINLAQVAVDDTDDSKPGVLCTCVLESDNVTFAWHGFAPELGTSYDCSTFE